jgi:hypothetical protein
MDKPKQRERSSLVFEPSSTALEAQWPPGPAIKKLAAVWLAASCGVLAGFAALLLAWSWGALVLLLPAGAAGYFLPRWWRAVGADQILRVDRANLTSEELKPNGMTATQTLSLTRVARIDLLSRPDGVCLEFVAAPDSGPAAVSPTEPELGSSGLITPPLPTPKDATRLRRRLIDFVKEHAQQSEVDPASWEEMSKAAALEDEKAASAPPEPADAKPEAAKAEAPKPEAPKPALPAKPVTAAKPAAPKAEPVKPLAPRPAAPRPAASKPAAPKPAAPKPAVSKPAAAKPGVPEPAAQKPAAPRPAAPRPGAPGPAPKAAAPRPPSTPPKPSTPDQRQGGDGT